MVPVITFSREIDNDLDLYERLIKVYGAVNNISLGQGDSRMLAYYIVHGANKESEQMMFEECRYASKQSIFNIKKSLVGKGLITRSPIDKNLITINSKLVYDIKNVVSIKVNLYTREFTKQIREGSK